MGEGGGREPAPPGARPKMVCRNNRYSFEARGLWQSRENKGVGSGKSVFFIDTWGTGKHHVLAVEYNRQQTIGRNRTSFVGGRRQRDDESFFSRSHDPDVIKLSVAGRPVRYRVDPYVHISCKTRFYDSVQGVAV